MANHPNRNGKYELVFVGSAMVRRFPRYRRWHKTLDAARDVAGEVTAKLDNPAAHQPIVYGPECGRDGISL